MKISYAIMAVPTRDVYVKELLHTLGDVPVSYDMGDGIWQNRVNAMMQYDKSATFHCVLQDDAMPCTDFYQSVENVVTSERAYSLYFGNRASMQQAAERGLSAGGIESKWLTWGVAIVLPTRIIPEIVDYWSKHTGFARHDDTRIAAYLKMIGMPVYYPMPSLVDHRHDIPSTMESTDTPKLRKAYQFKG